MTYSTTGSKIRFTGDGSTTTFNYTNYFYDNKHIQITHVDSSGTETAQTEGTHYTLTGAESAAGVITMVTAPATGEFITAERKLDITQERDLVSLTRFPANTIERGFDNSTMIATQLNADIDRGMQLKKTSTESGITLDDLTGNASKVMKVRSTEDGFDYVTLASTDVVGGFLKNTFSGDGATTAFTLKFSPTNECHILVVVDNVQKEPIVDYTVSGSTLTFTAAPASGTDNVYVIDMAVDVNEITPADDSVDAYMIIDGSIDSDEITDGIISTGKIAATTMLDENFATDAIAETNLAANALDDTTASSTLINDLSSATIAADDVILLGDSDDSDNLKQDTVQGILDLATGGVWKLLETQTASNSTSVDFDSDIDSTYRMFKVEMFNVIPATDGSSFEMRFSTDGGSTYDSSSIYAYHTSGNTSSSSTYTATAASSQAQFQLSSASSMGSSTGENYSGFVVIHNPSNGSLYTNISGRYSQYNASGESAGLFFAGTYKSTTAVDAFRFLMASGNISSGTFKLYGLE